MTVLPAASARFSFDDFRPLPLLGNPHLQTVLGVFLPSPTFRHPTTKRLLRLPDGDALLLYDSVPAGWRPGQRLALILHGLTGCASSRQVERLALLLLARGVRVARVDMRGAGRSLPLARQFYHAARSEDVRAMLAELHRWSPSSPLLLLGISLGGNIALKTAGEADTHPVPGLACVAALAPPIDMVRSSAMLELPRNRMYETRFVRDLVIAARRRQRHFPDLPPVELPRTLSVRRFDDLYTAPRSGFPDALDYYRRASSAALVERIAVPALLLTSRDDPFIAVEPFEELRVPEHITVRIQAHGGHVGFLGWDGAGGIRWAERRMVEWAVAVTE
jgi:predicted alpha/beta-fold hydrolase